MFIVIIVLPSHADTHQKPDTELFTRLDTGYLITYLTDFLDIWLDTD